MTDAMSRFIAAESARLRADGISEARIAWLLGTKPANLNRPLVPRMHGKRAGKVDVSAAIQMRSRGESFGAIAGHFGVTAEAVRAAVKRVTDPSFRDRERAASRRFYLKKMGEAA